MDMRARWNLIQQRVAEACRRSNRSSDEVDIVAVSKYATEEQIHEALNLGITAFGENRVQQAKMRMETFPRATWHLIGTLQTNKVRHCGEFALIHSLDRWRLAQALNDLGEKLQHPIRVLVQVNPGGEGQKHGLSLEDAELFVPKVVHECPHLEVKGLMAMAPFYEDPELTRPIFRSVKDLQLHIQQQGIVLPIVSMGMTQDFEVAVEEGATLVRIGSALFREEG